MNVRKVWTNSFNWIRENDSIYTWLDGLPKQHSVARHTMIQSIILQFVIFSRKCSENKYQINVRITYYDKHAQRINITNCGFDWKNNLWQPAIWYHVVNRWMHLHSTQSTLLLSDHSISQTVVLIEIQPMTACNMIH